jgi:hypothetical protein
MTTHTLNLTLNAHSPQELEAQLRSLRVALVGRQNELRDNLRACQQAGCQPHVEASYNWRIAFLDSVYTQMIEQEAEWLNQAEALLTRAERRAKG